MSGQLIELVFFAGIAFLIINKLISTLGTTTESDEARRNSVFGENNNSLKDITNSVNPEALDQSSSAIIEIKENLSHLIVTENAESVMNGYLAVLSRMKSFEISKFLKGAKAAFKIILALDILKKEECEQLIDKRYLEKFASILPEYGQFNTNAELNAKISEIYMFGNNVFVKVLFIGKNVTQNINDLQEEWTFSRNVTQKSPDWYLSNIDKSQ